MDLPRALAEGVRALREGRPADAQTWLAEVTRDADLAAAPDLQDIRARALTLHAQALIELGRAQEADAPCREAIRILRKRRDREGVDEARALQDRIVRALAEEGARQTRLDEQRRIAATPIDTLLAGARDEVETAERYVKKATAHLDLGDPEHASSLAYLALARAEPALDHHPDAATWAVFARLCLARAEPGDAETHLNEAWSTASRAGEHNLVSTIARAAEDAGVAVGVLHGPDLENPS